MDEMKVKILDLKERVLMDNDADADVLRAQLQAQGTYFVNVMSSPGSGKTTVILETARQLSGSFRIGVMEADIDSDVDARTMTANGIPAVQLHTGGMCHLSADMSRQGLSALGSEAYNLIFLENVGNLVCPAEFDTGAHLNLVLLSVPEGDDKPLKYPLMFQRADVVLITKSDAVEAFDFNMDRAMKHIHACKPDTPVFAISAETGAGIDEWSRWLTQAVRTRLEECHG